MPESSTVLLLSCFFFCSMYLHLICVRYRFLQLNLLHGIMQNTWSDVVLSDLSSAEMIITFGKEEITNYFDN